LLRPLLRLEIGDEGSEPTSSWLQQPRDVLTSEASGVVNPLLPADCPSFWSVSTNSMFTCTCGRLAAKLGASPVTTACAACADGSFTGASAASSRPSHECSVLVVGLVPQLNQTAWAFAGSRFIASSTLLAPSHTSTALGAMSVCKRTVASSSTGAFSCSSEAYEAYEAK
jgi:hypothetical protein